MAEGDPVTLDRVLFIADGDRVTAGTPTVDGARVMAKAQGEIRAEKIIVLKYKPKVRYRKKTGHRQFYTRLTIDEIIGPAAVQAKPATRSRQRKKEVTEDGT